MVLSRTAVARNLAAAAQMGTRSGSARGNSIAFRRSLTADTSRHQSTDAYSRNDDAAASLGATRNLPSFRPEPTFLARVKPVPSSFYTAQPVYTDIIVLLEELARDARRALQLASVPVNIESPNTSFARRTLLWLKPLPMSDRLSTPLNTSQHRHIVSRLQILARMRPQLLEHFMTGERGESNRRLAQRIEQTLRRFARDNEQVRSGEDEIVSLPRHAFVDDKGRAYGRGRRKESSARVWIAPSKLIQSKNQSAETQVADAATAAVSTSVLINAKPISDFFSRLSDRSAVTFPLRLTGLLGAFNIFALVRGGGTSGQAGAIAHGLSLAIVAHFDNAAKQVRAAEGADSLAFKSIVERTRAIRKLLKTDGVYLRDPRMVERKKTGKAKARKAYAWVKR